MEQARLTLPDTAICALPPQAEYRARSGRAEVSLQRDGGGMVTATATCDSLERVLELYELEYVYLKEAFAQLQDSIRSLSAQASQRDPPATWGGSLRWFAAGALCVAAAAVVRRKKSQ